MSLLSTTQLTSMRDMTAQALPDTASIVHGTWTDQGRGGRAFVASGTVSAACRVEPAGLRTDERPGGGGGPTAYADHTLFFAAGTDVRTTDQVTVGSNLYHVQSVLALEGWELTRVAQARLIGEVSV